MFDIAISQLTAPRWDLAEELRCLAEHGFSAISLWRPKVSDIGTATAARMLSRAGIRVSSLQWAGGFTGVDGRSFVESVGDAAEAIDVAGAVAAPVLVLHSGCRGGHTRSHAVRLLCEALERLVPLAATAGVTLALRPVHPDAAPGCSFLTALQEATDLVDRFDHPSIRLALDLWHFADDPAVTVLTPRLADLTAVVQVADRCGPPASGGDRLPAGHGSLPLEAVTAGLVAAGYTGTFEFDPVGETVELLGYRGVWRETGLVAATWGERLAIQNGAASARGPRTGRHYRRAAVAAGSRRSHASSQAVSPG